ncbi:hypothetical protein J2X36_003648 [Methylobacterium sp. BE186]|nr:hypothetical protein [Methylobacterium sp. BE186]
MRHGAKPPRNGIFSVYSVMLKQNLPPPEQPEQKFGSAACFEHISRLSYVNCDRLPAQHGSDAPGLVLRFAPRRDWKRSQTL